jgi:twitching motility protein PilT
MDRFKKIVAASAEQGVSDIHITGGQPVFLRKNGDLLPKNSIVYQPSEVDALANALLNVHQKAMLRKNLSVDLARYLPPSRLRVNVASTTRGLSLAVRLLPEDVPTVENLNLHPSLKSLCALQSGLILFCGPTGSGKSTTIAAMLEEINRTRAAHVITLEDPIEYRFRNKRAFIEQREAGLHFNSFDQALNDLLRQMPDVILVGELREPQAMRQTLNIAESGHLVFGTLHASNVEEAVYRLCSSVGAEEQELLRLQAATSLAAIVVQRLVKLENTQFRVPSLSVLLNTPAVKTLIRENKLSQIESALEMGVKEGMFTFKRYREYLQSRERFTPPALSFSPSKDRVEQQEDYVSALLAPEPQTGFGGLEDADSPVYAGSALRDGNEHGSQSAGPAPGAGRGQNRGGSDAPLLVEDETDINALISQIDKAGKH